MSAYARIVRTTVIVALTLLASGTALADSWKDKCASKLHCVQITSIAVSGNSASVDISEEPVQVAKNQKVVWILPEGYVFGYDKGKIDIPAKNNEVADPSALGDDGDTDSAEMTKRYKVKIAKKLDTDYKYTITFHELNGGKPSRMIECDPTIANLDSPSPVGKPRPLVKKSALLTCTAK